MEVWKDITGYEGLYQISNYGRVKSNYGEGKILKAGISAKQYYSVVLYKEKKGKSFKVHRLVAQEFIPNPNNWEEVNHRDENKLNNHVSNLEWCTHSYNTNYGTARERSVEKHLKKIRCIDTGEVFNSLKEGAEWAGLKKSTTITAQIKGQRKHAGTHPVTGEKLTWEYI